MRVTLRHKGLSEMIMAKANNTNNSAIKFNVTFGTKGTDAMPANAAILLRNCRKRIDGELVEVTEFMAVTGVRRTKGDSKIGRASGRERVF